MGSMGWGENSCILPTRLVAGHHSSCQGTKKLLKALKKGKAKRIWGENIQSKYTPVNAESPQRMPGICPQASLSTSSNMLTLALLLHLMLLPWFAQENDTASVDHDIHETVLFEASLWFSDAARAPTSGVLELFWVSVEAGNKSRNKTSNLQPPKTFVPSLSPPNFALTGPIKSHRKAPASNFPFRFSSPNYPSPNVTCQNTFLLHSSPSKTNEQNHLSTKNKAIPTRKQNKNKKELREAVFSKW